MAQPAALGETPGIAEPDPIPQELNVAVRVWTTRAASQPSGGQAGIEQLEVTTEAPGPPIKRRYPTEALVFDTETEPGPAQRVRLLVWRLYSDAPGEQPGYHCVEEGIAYPDDLPDRDPDGYAILMAHAPRIEADVAPGMGEAGSEGGLVIKPLSWWLEDRLYRYGYRHRDRCARRRVQPAVRPRRSGSYWGAGDRASTAAAGHSASGATSTQDGEMGGQPLPPARQAEGDRPPPDAASAGGRLARATSTGRLAAATLRRPADARVRAHRPRPHP